MRIELTVLGLLIEGNLYGYEIKKRIEERLESFLDVKYGSIYYAIKKAVQNGWIKQIGTEKSGESPERYIYQILPAGEKHYLKLLSKYFSNNLIHFNIDIMLLFYNSLPYKQKQQFIENRISLVKDKLLSIKEKIKDVLDSSSKSAQIYIYTYLESHLKAEQAWLRSLKLYTQAK